MKKIKCATVSDIKNHVHRVTNHLQMVLGYMEISENKKALSALHETIAQIMVLGKDLCTLTPGTQIAGLESLALLKIVSTTETTSTSATTFKVTKTKSKASAA